MDKNIFNSNQQTSCCEKLYAAVRNPSPLIRTVRFNKQQHPASHTTTALMTPTPLKDRCVRVKRVGAVSVGASPHVSQMTDNRKDHGPRVPKKPVKPPAADTKPQAGKVAVRQEHKGNHPHAPARTANQAKPTSAILPIGGHENKIPPQVGGPNSYIAQSINGMSSEFIERVGRKIRSPTNVGSQKPTVGRDSFNDKITNFIDVTKNKFHNALSFNEGTEEKEKRLK